MPAKPRLALTVQYADRSIAELVTRPLLRRWVQAALMAPAELTLRFVDIEEARTLNRDYRGRDYATNVLTFAYDDDDEEAGDAQGSDDSGLAGSGDGVEGTDAIDDATPTRADIVFCSAVLVEEARAQQKPLLAHAAHLVIHGVLHAQGYDHEDDADATEMESLETNILAALGWPDPYLAG